MTSGHPREAERKHDARRAGQAGGGGGVNHIVAHGAERREALRLEGTLQLAQVDLDVALAKKAVGLMRSSTSRASVRE